MNSGSIHNYADYRRRGDWQDVSGEVINADWCSVIIDKKILPGSEISGSSFLLGCYLTNKVLVGPNCILRGTYVGFDSTLLGGTSVAPMYAGGNQSDICLPINLGPDCRLELCDFFSDDKRLACESIHWNEETETYELDEKSSLRIRRSPKPELQYRLSPKKI